MSIDDVKAQGTGEEADAATPKLSPETAAHNAEESKSASNQSGETGKLARYRYNAADRSGNRGICSLLSVSAFQHSLRGR